MKHTEGYRRNRKKWQTDYHLNSASTGGHQFEDEIPHLRLRQKCQLRAKTSLEASKLVHWNGDLGIQTKDG